MRNGELEVVGSVIRRCLDATENGRYYRPRRRVNPGRRATRRATSEQLELFAPENVRIVQIVNSDPDRPLADLFPEAYQ